MGTTRRMYYRLDVAIDAMAMRTTGRGTGAPEALSGGEGRADAVDARAWTPVDRPRVLDISGSGVQIQTRSTELRVGDRVVIAFPFEGQDYRLSTSVVWTRRGQSGSAARAGLSYEGLDEDGREALVRAIYRAQRGAGRAKHR